MPRFEVVVGPTNREVMKRGNGIRELSRLREKYGDGDWMKCKGEATVALPNGRIVRVELHWYEAHGLGKRRMKIKRELG